jgi:hypothetical protein
MAAEAAVATEVAAVASMAVEVDSTVVGFAVAVLVAMEPTTVDTVTPTATADTTMTTRVAAT